MGIELSNIDGYQIERDHSRKGKKRHKGGASGGNREKARKEIEAGLAEEPKADESVVEETPLEESPQAETAPAMETAHVDSDSEDPSTLKAALDAEREQRSALEARMAQMEKRLAQAEAAAKATPVENKGDALGLVTLQAQAASDLEAQEQRMVLDTWMLEAQLRAAEEERAQEQLASTASILDLHQPREPMDERLRSAKAAVETAETRAADQARQVKTLTRELEEARGEQQRTADRLLEIESRLNQADEQASAAAPSVEKAPVEELEKAPEETAPVSPFEAPMNITATPEATDVAEEEEAVLSAALAGWGIDDDTDMDGGVVEDIAVQEEIPEEVVETSEADIAIEEVVEVSPEVAKISLADELSAWGAEETETAEETVDEIITEEDFSPEEEESVQPEVVIEETTIDDGGDEVDPEPEVITTAASDGPDSMMDALSNWGNMEPDAAAAKVPDQAVEQETEQPADSDKHERSDEGKEAMLDALMRFMGPK